MSEVIRRERPDLEEQRDQLVVSISQDKQELSALEDRILMLLKESEGNILDDEQLIDVLNNSKQTSNTIKVNIKQLPLSSARVSVRIVFEMQK